MAGPRRTVIVTGGARGIGLAIARRLAGAGDRLILWDRDGARAQDEAKALGPHHVAFACDIADEASVAAAADASWKAAGRIDGLVNNAGILGPVAPLWEHAAADFRRVVDVNLVGTFLVTKACVARMRDQRGPDRGRIVSISSIQAKEGMPMAAAYAASKAGIISLTKTLGKEVAGDGILVNAITPAAAETDMAKGDHRGAQGRDHGPHSHGAVRPCGGDRRDDGLAAVAGLQLLHRRRFRHFRRSGQPTEDGHGTVLGKGAICIWNGITPEGRAEFYDWHLNEHMPERRRGSRLRPQPPLHRGGCRYASGILHALRDDESGPCIRGRPTWRGSMRRRTGRARRTQAFRDTSRALTTVLASAGPGVGGLLATMRFAVRPGEEGSRDGRSPIRRGPCRCQPKGGGRPPLPDQRVRQRLAHGGEPRANGHPDRPGLGP